MKTFKKVVVLLLAAAMVFAAAACTPGTTPGGNADGGDKGSKDLKQVNMLCATWMEVPATEAQERVAKKINEIMNPLGVNVNMEIVGLSAWNDTVTQKLASGEQVDLMHAMDEDFPDYISTGAIQPVGDLLDEYGKDIKEAIGTDFQYMLDALTFGGELYGIPQLSVKHTWNDLVINMDIVDEYGLDISNINTIEDLEPVMLQLKEANPEIVSILRSGITFSGITAVCTFDDEYEALGDGIGVLMDDTWTVYDYYETPEFAEFCKLMRQWFNEGLISADMATSGSEMSLNSYFKTGNALWGIDHTTEYSADVSAANWERKSGVKTKVLPLSEAVCSNLIYSTVIPATSKNPDAAMMFLNELYKNSELMNTLYYGVEGEDWNNVDGFLTQIDGTNYFNNMNGPFSMMWGNYFITTPTAGSAEDVISASLEFTKNGKGIRSMGFMFDSSPVANEISAIQNVVDQYKNNLEFGTIDPETELPKMIEALKEAGIDKYIAEKQSQLDAWVAENNK